MHELNPHNNEIARMQQALGRAVEAVANDANADPLVVFPDPASKERRQDVVFSDQLTPEQETGFRAAMAELGPGRENSVGAHEAGLPIGYNAVLEGGQAHKMMAELELVLDDPVQPRQIIITGGVRRLGDKERELTAKLLSIGIDEVGETEFDVACQVITRHQKFEPFPDGARGSLGGDPAKVRGGYDLSKNRNTYQLGPYGPSDTGDQFVQLGTIDGGKPVIAMRVDRFPHPDYPDDDTKYIQPNNAQKMGIASHFLGARQEIKYGLSGGDNVALVTSATYEPSGKLSALEAETEAPRVSKGYVISYGTVALAAIKGEDPKQPDLNQLAGEACKVAKMLQKA